MATEKMRLEAEMRDSASPAIAKLRRELTELQNVSREGRAISKLNSELAALRREASGVRVLPGMGAVSGWFRKTGAEASDFAKAASGASTAFSTLGIGGLAATASIGGLAAAMREMGNRTLAMRELGREIGVSTDYLNAFSHAGQSFGVSSEAMQSALNHLSGQMPEFKRNYGALFNELSRWPDLIKKLQGEGAEDQVKDIVKFLGQAKLQNEPQLQKQLAELIFGNGADIEKLFAHGAQGLLNEIQRQQSKLGTISPEMLKAAQDYRDAQIGFTDSLEKFETTIGPRFLGVMSKIVDKATEFFDPDRSKIDKKQRDGGARDERERDGGTDWMNDPRVRDALRKKSGFGGSDGRGLLHLSSFGGGEGGAATRLGDGTDIIAAGTRVGFLAAMRELTATGDGGKTGAPGIVNASYETGGGGYGAGGGGRSFGGGGSGGGLGPGTAVDKTLPKEARALLDALAAGEAKDYNVMNGGGTFSDFSHHPGGRAAGRYQDLPSTWRRISGALGLKDFSPESQDKGNWWLAQQDYRSRTHRDLLGDLRSGNPATIANIGRALHSTWVSTNGSFAGRYGGALGRGAGGVAGAGGASYPGHIAGQMMIGGDSFRFGSGGVRGSSAIPFGDYPITPGMVGAWGRANGAMGVNGDKGIWDKSLGRMRTGIEMHAGHSANLITEGCLAFEQAMWPKVKAKVHDMIRQHGAAFVHVGPHGASITPNRRADGLVDHAAASRSAPNAGSQHQLDIRLHDRGGAVQSTSMKSSGHGLHPRLQRWPTAPATVDA